MRSADEELLGSWASITADLIKFFRSKDQSIYTDLASALESMADEDEEPLGPTPAPPIPAIAALMTVSTRAHAFLSEIPREEMEFDTSLVMGERTVEIPDRYTPLELPLRPEQIVLPDLRTIREYATAPCKHECMCYT